MNTADRPDIREATRQALAASLPFWTTLWLAVRR